MNALLEKLRDQARDAWTRIQETSLFMSLREKYEGLSVRVQKAIILAGSLLAVLFLLSFPYGYISTSQTSLSSFEENRELIRGLLKASGSLKEPSPLPPEISSEDLSALITRSLEEFHLVPEQVGGVQPVSEKVTNLVPDQVKQTGVSVSLKKLNIKQIVEISHRLQTLNPGTKVIGMDIKANATSHYFDVVYKIASFSIPTVSVPEAPGRGGKTRPMPKNQPKEENEGEG